MASNTEGGTRKLAAIMFTDVKDFSKKMGENELAAMDVLKIHDTFMHEIVAKHSGVVIKSLGDSFMVDFSSAVNAVRCAIEVEERFWNHNKDKPEFEKIQVRIGIHLGDVIIIGNDLFGDGVNIAARIEAITEPNRICVSAEIYNQIKNKMPIRAFDMGSIDLKNIAEPVEVFELLLDFAPELSEPSESAKHLPSRRRAEQLSAQEDEEAKKVEAARQKVDDEQQRVEVEKQGRANEHFVKAEEYFRAGDLANAEEEVKEIYKIVEIHYEAQMLILQIEEQRAQRDEEDRRRRVKEEKQRKEEERKQRIQKCLDIALQHVDQEQYAEALNALQEVYLLEPNNEQAKRIEKQVQFAEEARLERQRLEALAEEERVREETLRQERQRAEELAAAAIEKAAVRREQKPKRNTKLYVIIGAVALVVVVAAAVLLLTRSSLKKPAGVAVLPFTAGQAEDNYLGESLSSFMADEMARVPEMTTTAPTSSASHDVTGSNLQALGSMLGVTHIVRGSVSANGTAISLKAQLIVLPEGKPVSESSVQGSVLDLTSLASQATAELLKTLDIDVPPRQILRPTENAEAFTLYLRGLASVLHPSAEGLQGGISLLQQSLQKDSTFAIAKATLANALFEQFKRQGEWDQSTLNQATALAREAMKGQSNSALAHLVLGKAYRHAQQFGKARDEINASLAIQPGNSDCFRELALLSLIHGNLDEAFTSATTAMKIDPYHFNSQRVKGIVLLFREQYDEAAKLFDEATRLGGPDSLMTVSFKFLAWYKTDQEGRLISFCQQMMDRADDRGKVILYYWIGRAYSLKAKVDESLASFDQGIALGDRVLSANQQDQPTRGYFALLNARRAKRDVAHKSMNILVAADTLSAQAHYWKARMLTIDNDKAGALRELARAVQLRYSFPEILDLDFLSISKEQFLPAITLKF